MRKIIGLGIAICLAMLIIAPVAACHAEVTKTSDEFVCTTCDSYMYTIGVKSVALGAGTHNDVVRVTDTLPAGVEYVSYTDNGPVAETATCVDGTHALGPSCTKIQWDYSGTIPDGAQWTITLNVKPIDQSDGKSVINSVEAKVKHLSSGNFESVGTLGRASATTTFENNLCPIPSPEFPTLALPVGLIIGMLGVVLFIQKTKED
jgi:uncharacterized repeat protein (TIGR01451 family)